MKKIIIILSFFIFGCNYPDIDDIPKNVNLEITYEDKKNIEKLKEQINE